MGTHVQDLLSKNAVAGAEPIQNAAQKRRNGLRAFEGCFTEHGVDQTRTPPTLPLALSEIPFWPTDDYAQKVSA